MTNVALSVNAGRATFFNFGGYKIMNMDSVIALSAIIIQSLLAIVSYNRANSAVHKDGDTRLLYLPVAFSSIVFLCDFICGGSVHYRLLVDMMLAVTAMYVMISSLCPHDFFNRIADAVYVIDAFAALYYILCACNIVEMVPDSVFAVLSRILAVFPAGFFLWTIWNRIRSVKAVMKSGTVWSFLCLCVDAVYAVIPLAVFVFMHLLMALFPSFSDNAVRIASVFLLSELVALSIRSVTGNQFVILTRHENIIVESMKISHIEVMNSNPKADEIYKDVYERIVLYFEMNKPFLNSELTVNDVVTVVYSNKVYISKAISHYTGRNFRQFVNYHRVMYSMDLFRSNPLMKVTELAEKSGFNSVVSYSMSFRLFMNETPSDWCRKEKTKLIKTKK